MLVRDVMTETPVVAEMNTSLRVVMRNMQQHNIRHVPIVDGGKICAIVSDSEVSFLHGILDFFLDADHSFGEQILDLSVEHILDARYKEKQRVITVAEDASLEEAIDVFLEHSLSALPVTKRDSLQLVGVLSYIDILEYGRLNRVFAK